MDQKRIKEIRARFERATPEPWEYNETASEIWGNKGMKTVCGSEWGGVIISIADAEFISHARKDVPELLKEHEEYQKAETDRKLIMLPCKVGDIVYDIGGGTVYETEVLSFCISKKGVACRTISSYPDISEFGKRIFTTKDEAEAALKRKG